MNLLFLTATAALLSLTSAAQAQTANQSPVFAAEACRSGCSVVNSNGSFYVGSATRTYRVCTANGFAASITVDGTPISIPSTKYDVRGCVDVSGKSLTLTSGEIAVGPLPN